MPPNKNKLLRSSEEQNGGHGVILCDVDLEDQEVEGIVFQGEEVRFFVFGAI